jgi:hypothetical protein
VSPRFEPNKIKTMFIVFGSSENYTFDPKYEYIHKFKGGRIWVNATKATTTTQFFTENRYDSMTRISLIIINATRGI